jgi:radical SAM superfamily enzyme YgiQ (UPF0313 family)
MDFLSDVHEDRIVDYFRTLKREFGAKELRLIDSYFSIKDRKVRNILDRIREYPIGSFAGILLLKNRNHVEFLNEYVDYLMVGLESTSDFALKSIRKGYTWEDIRTAVDTIIAHMDRKIFLEFSIIMDLPFRDRRDLTENYRKILLVRESLEDAGFKVGVHMNILSLFPNLELLTDRPSFFKLSDRYQDLEVSTGKNYLIHLLEKAGMDAAPLLPQGEIIKDPENPAELSYGYLCSDLAVLRYDDQGNALPSDLHLVEEDVFAKILARKGKPPHRARR